VKDTEVESFLDDFHKSPEKGGHKGRDAMLQAIGIK